MAKGYRFISFKSIAIHLFFLQIVSPLFSNDI